MSVVARSPIGYQWPGRTAALDALAQWRLPYAGRLMSATKASLATDTQPIDELARRKIGAAGTSFSDDWYNRIHIRPGAIALGNLLSTQTRDVEVWNAYFEGQALNTLSANGADGISLTAPEDPPTTFGPLESRNYVAQIATDGPPTINASYIFGFAIGDRQLTITGKRVVVFAFAPNWSSPVTERLAWRTDVMRATDGSEQRTRLRGVPRRHFEYQLWAIDTHAARLDGLFWAWQSRVYALPVWTDVQRLTAPLASGQYAIAIETAHRDFTEGGLLVLMTGPATFEALEVSGVSAGGLELAKPVQNDWPAGTQVLPARLARLPSQVQLSRTTAARITGRVAFDVVDNSGGPDPAELGELTYRGQPVVTRQPNRAQAISNSYARHIDSIDNDTGVITIDDLSQLATDLQTWHYPGNGRADISNLRAWLYARAGQLTSFWAPSWHRDLEILEPVGASSAGLTVTDIGYRQYCLGRPGRRDIALLHRDGTWYCRRVTAAAVAGPGQELLSLDSALGIAANPADWRIVCYLVPMRLAADSITFSWTNDERAGVSLPLRSVLQ